MSESVLNTLIGLSGLGIACVVLLITYFINRKVGKKNRRFDERYYQITRHAKSIGWDVTLVVLLIAWGLVIIVDGIGFSFFLLTGIYVIHCLSLLFSGIYATKKHE
ncbi:DUF2178 domain-containing protein [Thalassobacillus hwangdonensis]|uniref:DUF2178 domain-containing protein n=1 Tax=Thalassobacillus hwangdonensis TaxID=546108 RepID=A0ABW3L028_9BACI